MKLELARDEARNFPEISEPEQYTELVVWHCKYKSLDVIAKFVNLEKLEIATVPDDSLDFLKTLKKLKSLRLLHLPNIHSLKALSELTALEGVSLETLPSWDSSGKKTSVASFEPLSQLKNLKTITLYGVVPEDDDYACLDNFEVILQHPKNKNEHLVKTPPPFEDGLGGKPLA